MDKVIGPESFNEGDGLYSILGPTGDFPEGKLNKTDEGGLSMAITVDVVHRKVVLNFGVPVTWIGFNANQAIAFSDMIRKKATELLKVFSQGKESGNNGKKENGEGSK